ncbi:MAG: PTS sugar transporter subunit IIA [Actinomycetales bacterium]|nr:PTS sugar transporter subunit IIA [Actinomycetales bacterium]
MSLINQALAPGSIRLGASVGSWQEAVELSGELLVASGRTTKAYTDAMTANINELGPYVVIAPGLAMPHARPSEAVLDTGMSLVTLREPVAFGHKKNDPVTVVFGLAALDHDKHLELLSEFAGKFSQPGFVNSLLSCHAESEIRSLFN